MKIENRIDGNCVDAIIENGVALFKERAYSNLVILFSFPFEFLISYALYIDVFMYTRNITPREMRRSFHYCSLFRDAL